MHQGPVDENKNHHHHLWGNADIESMNNQDPFYLFVLAEWGSWISPTSAQQCFS